MQRISSRATLYLSMADEFTLLHAKGGFIMVAGHLREKRGYYHIVLSFKDENGKRQTPSKSTGLPVKGNKKRAKAMLTEARQEMELELEKRLEQRAQTHPDDPSEVIVYCVLAGLA